MPDKTADRSMTRQMIKHIGIWDSRLDPELDNQREQVFAANWQSEQKEGQQMLLWRLLHGGEDEQINQEEATVAATVVQWLGSPVGWNFMERCIQECGFKLSLSVALEPE